MGNSQSSTRRRSSSPRAVKHKKSPNRFIFGSKKRAAQRQQVNPSTPAAIRNIKAKISPNMTSKDTSKKRRSSKGRDPASSISRKLNSMSFGNKKKSAAIGTSGKKKKSTGGLFRKSKRQSSPLPTITRRKKGLFSGMTSSKKKRNSVF